MYHIKRIKTLLNESWKLIMENYLVHHGILGMKWGIRRFQNKDGSLTPEGRRHYQNKDGSLTPEGRKRLGLDIYDKNYNQDSIVKKGTKVSRVVSTSEYNFYKDPNIGGSDKLAKQYVDNIKKHESEKETKYVSIDDVKNSGRYNGKEFYTSWFTDEGYSPDSAYVSEYITKRDMTVASGKQVVDEILKQVGSNTVEELLNSYNPVGRLTSRYTTDRELFKKVNKTFLDKGYDAVEDVNDRDTDMPTIILKSKEILGEPSLIQTGREAIDEILKSKY